MQRDYLKVVAGHIKRDALDEQIKTMYHELQIDLNKSRADCIMLRQYIEANLVRHALIHHTYIFRPNGAKLDIVGVSVYNYINKNQYRLNNTIKLYEQISVVIHEGNGVFIDAKLLNLMNLEFKQQTFKITNRTFITPSLLTVKREALYNQVYQTSDYLAVQKEVDLILSVLSFSKTSKINKTMSLIDAKPVCSLEYQELKAAINTINNHMHFSLKKIT